MKLKNHREMLPAKIGLIFLGLLIFSCNTLKRVEENELLLTDYTIEANGQKVSDPAVNSFILQKPNSTVLGFPLRLHLYNLAKPNADSQYQDWLERKPKRKERLEALLSKKQTERLGQSFLVGGYSQWLKRVGEAPVIIDTASSSKSLNRISTYYDTRGYFNNTGVFTVDTLSPKKGTVTYSLNLGSPYVVDSIRRNITSPMLDSLYAIHRQKSLIKKGDVFDLETFTLERERLTDLFRNSGIWNFQESSISYNIMRDTVNPEDQSLEIDLNIQNLRSRNDTLDTPEAYRIHKMSAVNLYADYDFQYTSDDLESVTYLNYRIFYKDRLRYKPKALAEAVFLQKDSIYRDIDRLRTYRQINNLNTFRYPTIELLPNAGDKLDANIYLTARPRNSLSLDFDVSHSNIQLIGVGTGASLLTRNVLGGAETLSLSGRGNFGLLSDDVGNENFFTEVRADVNLNFPRIWLPPFKSLKIIPYYMLPQTRVSLGTSFQNNIGLDKQTFNTILGYNWSPSEVKKGILELINLRYVRNLNPDRFFNQYQSTFANLDGLADEFENNPLAAPYFQATDSPENPLRLIIPEGTTGFTSDVLNGTLVPQSQDTYAEIFRIEERRIRLTENNLILSSNYTYTKNSKTDLNDKSFYQLRWKVEGAGNLLSGLTNLISFNRNEAGKNMIFGVPYSQYVKTELEFIRHWELSASEVLAFRSFGGIAVPLGNANDIPFVSSYFAGGSNDNRAWYPYSLGPGRTQNLNDFNEANFKLALNLEYRFPVVGDLKGALFSDLGNIWNVWDSQNDPAAKFSGLASFKDLAWGAGLGLRYDFTYFVFRADLGFKAYNPADKIGKRWFRDFNFANSVLQIGINYPF